MAKEKLDKFHISYDLDPKTQDVKLTFSQGKHRCVVTWYDKEENSWRDVTSFCGNLEAVLKECGSDNFHINWSVHRIIIIVGGYMFHDGHVFIVDPTTRSTNIEGMELVTRKKLYGKFKVEPLEFIRELYSVVTSLACNPRYVGADKRYTKKSKLEFLSSSLSERLDPKNGVTNYHRQVLECLKDNAYDGTDFYCRGLAFFNEKKYKNALENFNLALKKRKTLADITWCYIERGRTYVELKQLKKAKKDFLTAIRRCPNWEWVYAYLDNVYTQLGQHDKAFATALKAHKLYPDDPALLYNLAMHYRRKKQFKKTLSLLEKAHEEDPAEASIIIQMGGCYLEMKNFQREKSLCEQVLADLSSGEIKFRQPEVDQHLLGVWAGEFLKRKEYDLATKLAQAGKALEFEGYDSLLKKIEKQAKLTKK